ncbi:MAG: GtrA family protein [Blautia faecis]
MIDYGMYSLLTAITATGFANGGAVAFSNIGARIVSAVFNYMVNRNMVFQSKENPVRSALKYFTLAVGIRGGKHNYAYEILVNAIGMNHYVGKLCTEFIFSLQAGLYKVILFFQKKEE